jgi:hypothetical protein
VLWCVHRTPTRLSLTCAHSSAIIDDLQSDPDHLLAYFYSAIGQDQIKETFSIILGSWIAQLARRSEHCLQVLQASYKEHDSRPEPGASERVLRDLLLSMLRASQRTVLVLDALDQCSDSTTHDLLSSFLFPEQYSDSGTGALAVCFLMTSRHVHSIHSRLPLPHSSIRVLDLFAAIERDKEIEGYIDRKLEDGAYQWDNATKYRARSVLKDKARGMCVFFLSLR